MFISRHAFDRTGAGVAVSNYRRDYAEKARALSEISIPSVILTIGKQWATIALAFWASWAAGRYLYAAAVQAKDWEIAVPYALGCALVFALSFFVIGSKQHALMVIMHDASHYRLLRNRRLNDLVSNLFCAFPTGMITSSYRPGHLSHHVAPNSPYDPYWVHLTQGGEYNFPMPRRELWKLLCKDMTGLNLRTWWPGLRLWTGWAYVFRDKEKFLDPSERAQFTVFWATVLLVNAVFGTWLYFIFLWLLPMFTLMLALNRLRIIAEHDLNKRGKDLEHTRHVDGNWLERFALAPLNVNFHIAHHLFPSVPLYNLPKLHAVLMRDSGFREEGEIWKRYLGKAGLISGLLS
jgi:fatty acid desaturase